jgi:DMSO/TMAO reductase YedYZ molybdopterin-dependent catalytic subunit
MGLALTTINLRKPRRIVLIVLLILLCGCQPTVSSAQLDQWYKEVVVANDRLIQAQASNLSKDWKITIQGEVERPITLNWAEIEQLATQELNTYNPYADNPRSPTKYHGIPIKTLFDRAGVKVGATSITLVAADAYYASMPLTNAINDGGLLAIRENGKPIPRSNGGPVYMVYAIPPNAPTQNDNQAWAYYTTHIIVGTEPLRLKVGQRNLTRFDIEKLPTTSIRTLVGYKIGWDSTATKLTGVKLTTLFEQLKMRIPAKAIVRIRRKAMTNDDAQKYVELSSDLMKRCDVLLAYRWGNDSQTIPAQKGGPLTLAYGNNCTSDDAKDLAWLPFVESIDIEEPRVNR